MASVSTARAAALLVAALALAAPARADSGLEVAKGLTNLATLEYNVGKFQQALDLYSKAYEHYPTPALLFDIGQCHRMLKSYERAIFFFRGYLRADPNAFNQAAVELLVAESQRRLDEQHAVEEAEKAKAEAALTPVPAASAPAIVRKPDPDNPTLRTVGMLTAGAGIAAVGVGVYFGVHAGSLASTVSGVSSSHGTWDPEDQSNYDGGRSAAAAAMVLYVAGGVAVATGAVLTYLGWPRGRAGRTGATASVAPTAGGGELVVVGTF